MGRFQIRELLGTGAFGAVYRAYDPKLDREVALKVPQADVLEKKQLERFLPEARAAARLRHPNIVPVFEIGQDSGRYYIVTAFIPGQSLEDAIEGKGLELSRGVRIIRALAEAVVPEGRLKLAQRFIAGSRKDKKPPLVPEGRLNIIRPYGTLTSAPSPLSPSNKLLGYFQSSLRDGRSDNAPGVRKQGARARNK